METNQYRAFHALLTAISSHITFIPEATFTVQFHNSSDLSKATEACIRKGVDFLVIGLKITVGEVES